MEISRKYEKTLEKELNFEEITALLGSRQVGKTTLMKNLYKNIKKKSIYLTFDDISILKTFEENIALFKEQYVDPYEIIFIDEIQYSKKSGKNLKFLFDSTKKKFFISGSSTPELSINSLSYLVGRIRVIEIFPLTFREFVSFKDNSKAILFNKIRKLEDLEQLSSLFQQYLQYGGYPKVILYPVDEKEKTLKGLVNTYLLKEIKEILEFKDIFEFESVLNHLALIDGNILNKSSISQDLGVNFNKLSQMISTLNNTYITYQVNPFLKNKVKEQIKSPKIYFQDLGFKNTLINNFNRLELRQDKGEILENFVLNILVRSGFKVKYWNYKNRFEIDFVIEKNNKIIGFEVKSKLSKSDIPKSTKEFISRIKPHKVFILNETIQKKSKYEDTSVEFEIFFNLIPLLEKGLFTQ